MSLACVFTLEQISKSEGFFKNFLSKKPRENSKLSKNLDIFYFKKNTKLKIKNIFNQFETSIKSDNSNLWYKKGIFFNELFSKPIGSKSEVFSLSYNLQALYCIAHLLHCIVLHNFPFAKWSTK